MGADIEHLVYIPNPDSPKEYEPEWMPVPNYAYITKGYQGNEKTYYLYTLSHCTEDEYKTRCTQSYASGVRRKMFFRLKPTNTTKPEE